MRSPGLLLAVALLGCGAAESEVSVRSSPLLAVDSDRLWILLQAARINPRCREYYAEPSDPRLAGLAEKCTESERRAVAWLHANRVDDPREEDLREPAFWQWYASKLESIRQCRREFAPGSKGYWAGFYGCDPFDRIVRVDGKTMADAGYREPRD